jgi:hypothetical protein
MLDARMEQVFRTPDSAPAEEVNAIHAAARKAIVLEDSERRQFANGGKAA